MKNDEQNFMPFIKLRYQNSLEMSPNSTLAKPYLKNIGSCAKVSTCVRADYIAFDFLASFGSYISLVSLIVFLFVIYYTLIGTDEKKIFLKELPFSKFLKKS